jgi:hypothetical protein
MTLIARLILRSVVQRALLLSPLLTFTAIALRSMPQLLPPRVLFSELLFRVRLGGRNSCECRVAPQLLLMLRRYACACIFVARALHPHERCNRYARAVRRGARARARAQNPRALLRALRRDERVER